MQFITIFHLLKQRWIMTNFKGCKVFFLFPQSVEQPSETLDWHCWLEHDWSHAWLCALIYSFGRAKGLIHFCFLWWNDHYKQSIMDFNLCLCCGRMEMFTKSFDNVASSKRFSVDNLMKVIVESLFIYSGILEFNLASKLVCFGVDGVTTFQGSKIDVTM